MHIKIEVFQKKNWERNMLNPISLAFRKAKEEKRPALLTYTVATV